MLFGFDLTALIQVLGYPGIFAVILAESGLFFGVSLPGGSLLFTAGLLASQGLLNIWVLSAVVLAAAILGDAIGYWFGSWVGPALWRRPDGRFFKKQYLIDTRAFFEKHGTRTILLARFIPVIRTFAPIVAGVAEMRYQTFFLYNVLGALVWGGGYTLAGYALGETVPGIEEYLEYIVIGIIVVTGIPFLWHVWESRRAAKKRAVEMPESPRAVIFDLYDTLTESFQPPAQDVLDELALLARRIPVAIMTGAAYARVERDILQRIRPSESARFYVFSDTSARAHMWESGSWRELYAYEIAPADRQRIATALAEAADEARIFDGEPDTSRILDRVTSVAWAALPHEATQHEKRAWDADGVKRHALIKLAREKLPEFEVTIGGKTTVDVTRSGITKAHGVEWLGKELALEPKTMLFVGDNFGENGNDTPVIPTGIRTVETSGPDETREIIAGLLETIR